MSEKTNHGEPVGDGGNEAKAPEGFLARSVESGWTVSGRVTLADRPGELAALAGAVAACKANIEVFRFNRSLNPHLVELRAAVEAPVAVGDLLERLDEWAGPAPAKQSVATVTDPAGLLSVTLTLIDRPGELARVAEVFRDHRANVLHMDYNGDDSPGIVRVSMATDSPAQVRALLSDLTEGKYHHHVEWTGENMSSMEEVLGLNHVESFLFKLRAVLPPERLAELSDLIHSSDELSRTLAEFRRESGESDQSLAASEVFTTILQLAAVSNTRTGPNFALRLTGPLRITDRVRLYMLACPTGGNAYLFRVDGGSGGEEFVFLDTGYGLFFPDVVDWMSAHGMDPERISRAYLTHADADHAGWGSFLKERYGTEVFMHADCRGVMDNENRAWGSGTRLMALNGLFTTLVSRFTSMRPVPEFKVFSAQGGGQVETVGGFKVLDAFVVGDVAFDVLEAFGGHVPGQVFFLSKGHGLLFSGDHLIDVLSLSDRTKSTLSLARFLMTSTNVDSRAFMREMLQLQDIMRGLERTLAPEGGQARVFPGHGEFYSVRDVEWGSEEA